MNRGAEWGRIAVAAHKEASGFRDEDGIGEAQLQIWQLLVSIRNLCDAEGLNWHTMLTSIDEDYPYLRG